MKVHAIILSLLAIIKTHSSTGSYHYWENDLKCQSIKVNEIIFYDL